MIFFTFFPLFDTFFNFTKASKKYKMSGVTKMGSNKNT